MRLQRAGAGFDPAAPAAPLAGELQSLLHALAGAAVTAGTLVAFTTVQARLLMPLMGLLRVALDLQTSGAKLNYGVNKVRFPHPLLVGSRVRLVATVGAIAEVPAGRQLTLKYVVEIEGQDKPACVAETVVLLLA